MSVAALLFPHFGCICNITQPLGCWWHCLPPKNPILSNAPTSNSLFDLAAADKIRKRSAATCYKHNLYIYQLRWISPKCSQAKLCRTRLLAKLQNQLLQSTERQRPPATTCLGQDGEFAPMAGLIDWQVLRATRSLSWMSAAEVQKWATLLGHGDGPPFKPTPSTTVEEALWCNKKPKFIEILLSFQKLGCVFCDVVIAQRPCRWWIWHCLDWWWLHRIFQTGLRELVPPSAPVFSERMNEQE